MTTIETADLLGISPATLETWRSRRVPHQPPYFKVGNRVVYQRAEVERFMQTCRRVGK